MQKHTKRLEIAVYGKGGIGKSTMSANLTAALTCRGKKVLQIGCDPKHDSTRLLMDGEIIPTVLDYLKSADQAKEDLHAVLREGYGGCGCIEAGGPKPGVGCAGRGILSAFEFLKNHNVKENYDLIVYDVLGDVVCGGFAVPVRQEYADAVFLVTSGEYMALYAANNILRGIYNFDGDKRCRVAGIIYNERKVSDEDNRVRRFAEAVGLPICTKVPRSNAFAHAEEQHVTLAEMEGCEEEKQVFLKLADRIIDGLSLYPARPLSDERLEQVVLNLNPEQEDRTKETVFEDLPVLSETPIQKNDTLHMYRAQESTRKAAERLPLYGCAFNGASTCAIHLTDAIVIAHTPRACAFYTWQNISSPGRKNLFNRGILMPSSLSPNFISTDITQSEVVFGGMDLLKEAVSKALLKKPGTIIVISSCVSGIIGDDIRAVEEMSTDETKIITIAADGDIAGDYMEGIRMCMHTLGERLIERNVPVRERSVNIINEIGVSINKEVNIKVIRSLLDRLDIQINCRFLGDATTKEMQHFLSAPLNLLASDSRDSLELKKWLEDTYGCQFLPGTLPVGFKASADWALRLGEYFHVLPAAKQLVGEEQIVHDQAIARLRPFLSGKRIIMTTINANLDWFIDSAIDAGMEFVWIGVLNYLRIPIHITKDENLQPVVHEVEDWVLGDKEMEELKPDLVLSNYTTFHVEGEFISDAIPMTPVAGFHSAIPILERFAKLFKRPVNNQEEGWKNDEFLFEKYFS